MHAIVKHIESALDKAGRIIPKFLRFGKSDVQTAPQVSPFGFEGFPKGDDLRAFYVKTDNNETQVIVGYILKDVPIKEGETRMYSIADKTGNIEAWVYCRDDGKTEFSGNTDNLVRYNELLGAFNQLKNEFNSFVNTYNLHTHAVAGAVASATTDTATGTTADLSPAKIEELLCSSS